MHKLSIIEMKSLKGGGDTQSTGGETQGTGGETQSTGGETSHGTRNTCIALVQYRHSSTTVFTRVANCGSAAKEGVVVNCYC